VRPIRTDGKRERETRDEGKEKGEIITEI